MGHSRHANRHVCTTGRNMGAGQTYEQVSLCHQEVTLGEDMGVSRRSSTRTLGSHEQECRCQLVARLECSGCKQAGMATTPNDGIGRQHRCKQACPCHSMQTLGHGSAPTEVLVSSEGCTQRQQLQAFVSLLPCGDIGRGRYRYAQAATWQPWQRARMLTAMPVMAILGQER